MTTIPKLPDREALRTLFDAAVHEIKRKRTGSPNLAAGFYAQTGNSVFEASYSALEVHCDEQAGKRRPRMLPVVAAPVGSGKTSFSYAMIMAITRYAERNITGPYGCAFLTDQITKADEAFKELNVLLPGKVAIWTTEHDPGCKKREKVLEPAGQFKKQILDEYPVIVATHAFFNGRNGHFASRVCRNDEHQRRALTIIDERPEDVSVFEITVAEAEQVASEIEHKRPELREHLARLRLLMTISTTQAVNNSLIKPLLSPKEAFEDLSWFTTQEAERLIRKATSIVQPERYLAVARAMARGWCFAAVGGDGCRFVGYDSKLMRHPGMILLDATADIDGVTNIVSWRGNAEVPKARYDNLNIVHVPQHTKKRPKEYLRTAKNQRAYVSWMVDTIKQHMAPGEKGLVVCKKTLFDNEQVPNWDQDDERFDDHKSYTEQYQWVIDGRELCATHWGTGIGSNAWQEADVVFLFDEFYIPRRSAIGAVQAYREHHGNEGELAQINSIKGRSKGFDTYAEGHRLRWTKQLALRGRGRVYDEHGVCGRQRLVVACDLKAFTANAERMFPGANITISKHKSEGDTWASKVLRFLGSRDHLMEVTTKQLSQALGTPWRSISSNLKKQEHFEADLKALGWTYVPGRGRGGSRFKRIARKLAEAA